MSVVTEVKHEARQRVLEERRVIKALQGYGELEGAEENSVSLAMGH